MNLTEIFLSFIGMNKTILRLISKRFLLGVLLSIIFVLLSEPVTTHLFSGLHDAGLWLLVVQTGLFIIWTLIIGGIIIKLVRN